MNDSGNGSAKPMFTPGGIKINLDASELKRQLDRLRNEQLLSNPDIANQFVVTPVDFTTSQIDGSRMMLNGVLQLSWNPTELAKAIQKAAPPMEPTWEGFPRMSGGMLRTPEHTYTWKATDEWGNIIGSNEIPQEEPRPSFDATFMEVAKVIAKRGTCPRLQVGAVITIDDKIESTGYNGAPSDSPHCSEVGCLVEAETGRCKRTVHAEVNAILQAAYMPVTGVTLYTTHFPCVECASIIANTNIDRLVYLADNHYPDGSRKRALDILNATHIDIIDFVP